MDVSKERNTLLCLDTKHFFTFSHSICYRKQFQSILAKRNIHSFKHTIHVTQHNVSRHADSPEGENTAYETPRTSQETVNGMAWYCQKGMKYHKFSLFTNSQSKKCHNVSRRSDRTPQETVNGTAWYCQETKYHPKFSQFTNSQSKKCPHHSVQLKGRGPPRPATWL